MERKIIYTFTDTEIEEAVYKFKNNYSLNSTELLALAAGAEKWVEFKKECKADPSYQWGYGHCYY